MSRIRVVVTAEDIFNGKPYRYDGTRCAIARAVHRAGFPKAHVSANNWRPYAEAFDEALDPVFPLTKRMRAWVDDFDHHRSVEPATFLIEGPTPTEVPV